MICMYVCVSCMSLVQVCMYVRASCYVMRVCVSGLLLCNYFCMYVFM